jgi:phosphopentomutase
VSQYKRVILIVLDSVGIGASKDADRFGDQGANTLGNIAKWCSVHFQDFTLPNLSQWGIGNLVPNSFGIPTTTTPKATTATLRELSPGKDTTTGHWEIAGTVLKNEFPVYENGFSEELLNQWCEENNLPGWLANKAASGTTIIDELGEEHIRTGKPIVYTSADSVFQVACSEESFGLERLYEICKSARKLVDRLGLGRVIARPFVGNKVGSFQRTENRKDYSVPPPFPNLLDLLLQENCFVAGVGKIEDIFAHRGVSLVNHTGRNETSIKATLEFMKSTQNERGLIFTNLIDFDMLHGHRRNPKSYAEALMDFDKILPQLESACGQDDLLILTADHGNDPTHSGTDHTRENVPLLMWSPNTNFQTKSFETLDGFCTISKICLEALGLEEALNKLPDAKKSPSILRS